MTFVRNNLPLKLLIAVTFCVAFANANVLYTTQANSTDSSGNPDAAQATVFLSNAPGQTCGATGGCVLNVELLNLLNTTTNGITYANIGTIAQGISGLTFTLTNVGTTLSFSGASITSISSDNAGGSIPTLNPTGTYSCNSAITCAAVANQWQIGSNTTSAWGPGGLELTVLGNQKPVDLIVPSGVSAGVAGFSAHKPQWEGPVYFQITGISGLTTNTDISNVEFLFGTSAEGVATEGSCSQSGGGNCSIGQIGTSGPTPEPVSFLLAGGALIALVSMRRRFVSAQ